VLARRFFRSVLLLAERRYFATARSESRRQPVEDARHYRERAIPRKEVSELFGISRSTIKGWLKRRRQTGDVETMKIPGRPALKGEALRKFLPPGI
jgi:transposase